MVWVLVVTSCTMTDSLSEVSFKDFFQSPEGENCRFPVQMFEGQIQSRVLVMETVVCVWLPHRVEWTVTQPSIPKILQACRVHTGPGTCTHANTTHTHAQMQICF